MCFHRSPTIHWWYFRGGIYEVKKASKSGQMLLCQKETHVTKTTDGVAKQSKAKEVFEKPWHVFIHGKGDHNIWGVTMQLFWKLNCPGPQMGSSDMTKNGKTIRSDWDGIQWCRPQHRQWLMHWMYDAVLMRGPLLGWVRPAELVVKLARHPPNWISYPHEVLLPRDSITASPWHMGQRGRSKPSTVGCSCHAWLRYKQIYRLFLFLLCAWDFIFHGDTLFLFIF